jgi:dTDP-4-amino-4,6-dideoxygalactose transaminase
MPEAEAIERWFAYSREAGWFANAGPCHERLVESLSERVPPEHECVLVASGTVGLIIALRAALGRPKGSRREVIMPAFTFIATLNAVRWAGYEPVFADVDPQHWHLDPASVASLLEHRSGRVAGMLAVSAFGAAPPRAVEAAWQRLAADAEIPLVVDSAAGFGATDDTGRPLGGQGDVEVFSFHATKPFAIGEGGLITTDDADLADRAARLANFDFDRDRVPVSPDGLNGKLDELHCAVGLAVLEEFDAILAARATAAAQIRAPLEAAGLQFQAGCARSTWQFVPALVRDERERERVGNACAAAGIEIRQYYQPLHRMPAFAATPATSLDVTEDVASRQISLPMSNRMSPATADAIVRAVLAGVG